MNHAPQGLDLVLDDLDGVAQELGEGRVRARVLLAQLLGRELDRRERVFDLVRDAPRHLLPGADSLQVGDTPPRLLELIEHGVERAGELAELVGAEPRRPHGELSGRDATHDLGQIGDLAGRAASDEDPCQDRDEQDQRAGHGQRSDDGAADLFTGDRRLLAAGPLDLYGAQITRDLTEPLVADLDGRIDGPGHAHEAGLVWPRSRWRGRVRLWLSRCFDRVLARVAPLLPALADVAGAVSEQRRLEGDVNPVADVDPRASIDEAFGVRPTDDQRLAPGPLDDDLHDVAARADPAIQEPLQRWALELLELVRQELGPGHEGCPLRPGQLFVVGLGELEGLLLQLDVLLVDAIVVAHGQGDQVARRADAQDPDRDQRDGDPGLESPPPGRALAQRPTPLEGAKPSGPTPGLTAAGHSALACRRIHASVLGHIKRVSTKFDDLLGLRSRAHEHADPTREHLEVAVLPPRRSTCAGPGLGLDRVALGHDMDVVDLILSSRDGADLSDPDRERDRGLDRVIAQRETGAPSADPRRSSSARCSPGSTDPTAR